MVLRGEQVLGELAVKRGMIDHAALERALRSGAACGGEAGGAGLLGDRLVTSRLLRSAQLRELKRLVDQQVRWQALWYAGQGLVTAGTISADALTPALQRLKQELVSAAGEPTQLLEILVDQQSLTPGQLRFLAADQTALVLPFVQAAAYGPVDDPALDPSAQLLRRAYQRGLLDEGQLHQAVALASKRRGKPIGDVLAAAALITAAQVEVLSQPLETAAPGPPRPVRKGSRRPGSSPVPAAQARRTNGRKRRPSNQQRASGHSNAGVIAGAAAAVVVLLLLVLLALSSTREYDTIDDEQVAVMVERPAPVVVAAPPARTTAIEPDTRPNPTATELAELRTKVREALDADDISTAGRLLKAFRHDSIGKPDREARAEAVGDLQRAIDARRSQLAAASPEREAARPSASPEPRDEPEGEDEPEADEESEPVKTRVAEPPARPGGSAKQPAEMGSAQLIVKDAKAWKPIERTFKSRYYEITTDLPPHLAKMMTAHMDAVYQEYSRRFAGFKQRGKLLEKLAVFGSRKAYLAFLGKYGVDGRGSAGMFYMNSRGEGLAAFLGDNGMAYLFNTLRHEGFHQFAWARLGEKLPWWADEGMAEYFGESIMAKGRLKIGKVNPERLDRLRAFLKRKTYFRLKQLLNMSANDWNYQSARGHGTLLYDQSWSVVHFLVHGRKAYRAAFVRYLEWLAKGKETAEAYKRAFGTTDYTRFEAAWKEYVEKLKPDPEKTAAGRLEFLAGGMIDLLKNRKPIQSLEQMQRDLIASNYDLAQPIASGLVMRWSARDDKNFRPPQNEEKTATMTLVKASDPRDPPSVVVQGHMLEVRLDWLRDHEGRLVSHISYR